MKYANTTPLELGMTGEFLGKRYRIAGRLVMGMDEGGETYTWNEFHLVADDGSSTTLVHEVTENGVEWRMFTLIEPMHSLTAAEAASRRVGESIDISGKSMRINCVDESRVLHIEGEAPEGVDLGDVAHYFNAESGNEMIVVSWTGDEVEFYRGVTLPAQAVTGAFGVPPASCRVGTPMQTSGASVFDNAGTRQDAGGTFALRPPMNSANRAGISGKMIAGVVAVLIAVAGLWFFNSSRTKSSTPPKLPKTQLIVGKSGELLATRYRITGRAVVEIARVGKRFLRHEYVLTDDNGSEDLLVQGSERSGDEWLLLTSFRTERPLTSQQVGALRLGDALDVDGSSARVTEMFLSRVQSVEGATAFVAGTPLYGLLARSGTKTFAARWNETSVTFYRVTPLPAKSVTTSFK